MTEYTLVQGQIPSQDTFAVITNLWDYKLSFLCPICGILWYTPEKSRVTGDTRPSDLYVHCARDQGCNNHYRVVFVWREL